MTFNNNCKELKLSDRASSEKNTAGSPHPPCLRGKKFMARLAPEDTCWKTTVIIHARLRLLSGNPNFNYPVLFP
jgi:hypothetical protein